MPAATPLVAVYGASDNPERYAHKAILSLREHGCRFVPLTPRLDAVEGERAYRALADVPEPVDTVTMYVGPERQAALAEDLVAACPRRVVFNPGTENPELEARLRDAGVHVVEACTLVLLATGMWETA